MEHMYLFLVMQHRGTLVYTARRGLPPPQDGFVSTVGGKHEVCCVHSDIKASLGIVSHCFWHALKYLDVRGSALRSSLSSTQPKSSSAIQTLRTFPVLCLRKSHLSPSRLIRLPLKGLCILQTAWRRRAGVAGKMKNSVIYWVYRTV